MSETTAMLWVIRVIIVVIVIASPSQVSNPYRAIRGIYGLISSRSRRECLSVLKIQHGFKSLIRGGQANHCDFWRPGTEETSLLTRKVWPKFVLVWTFLTFLFEITRSSCNCLFNIERNPFARDRDWNIITWLKLRIDCFVIKSLKTKSRRRSVQNEMYI